MTFSEALQEMKNGQKVTRNVWGGKTYLEIKDSELKKHSMGFYIAYFHIDQDCLAEDWENYYEST